MKMRMMIGVLAGVLIHVLVCVSWGASREAVVKVVCSRGSGSGRSTPGGGVSLVSGSGVCVDPEGVILTAAHVVRGGSCRVIFGSRSYAARKVLVPEKENVAVLQVVGARDWPYLEIAARPPRPGERVWVMGYPEGRWFSFATRVTSNRLYFADEPGTRLTGVSAPVRFGTSGGPLVTREWKVAGIASVSGKITPSVVPRNRLPLRSGGVVSIAGRGLQRTGGMFLALEHVWAAVRAVQPESPGRPVVYAFTSPDCPACRAFRRDAAAGVFDEYDVRVVEYGTPHWGEMVAEVQRAGGGPNPTRNPTPIPEVVPFFWVEGSGEVVHLERYHVPGLLQVLARIVAGLGRAIYNPDAVGRVQGPEPRVQSQNPALDSQPSALDPPSEADRPPPAVNWAGVEAIILGKKQEVGQRRGALRAVGLKLLSGRAERGFRELTEGKAQLHIVDERTNEEWYTAVTAAAAVDPERFYVIVLVDKQPLGLIRGFIAGKLEERFREWLGERDLPIEVIARRTHPEDYERIRAALAAQPEEYHRAATMDMLPSAKELAVELARESSPLWRPVIREQIAESLEERLPAERQERISAGIELIRKLHSESKDTEKNWKTVIVSLLAGLLALMGWDKFRLLRRLAGDRGTAQLPDIRPLTTISPQQAPRDEQ